MKSFKFKGVRFNSIIENEQKVVYIPEKYIYCIRLDNKEIHRTGTYAYDICLINEAFSRIRFGIRRLYLRMHEVLNAGVGEISSSNNIYWNGDYLSDYSDFSTDKDYVMRQYKKLTILQ